MTQQTKAERSESAKKAAATRQKNEAKNSGNDLKNAAGNAVDAAKDIGEARCRHRGQGRQGRVQAGRLLTPGQLRARRPSGRRV